MSNSSLENFLSMILSPSFPYFGNNEISQNILTHSGSGRSGFEKIIILLRNFAILPLHHVIASCHCIRNVNTVGINISQCLVSRFFISYLLVVDYDEPSPSPSSEAQTDKPDSSQGRHFTSCSNLLPRDLG